MKVVILCGGRGTRLNEETTTRPKPLVEIGNRPILWHIMKTYSHYGFNEFVLCLGYKGWMIKDYFLNYETMNNDFTMKLGSKDAIHHNHSSEKDWTITFAETGEDAQTGARVKKIEKYIDEDSFMLTYGDGVSDVNIKNLVDFHKSHGQVGTVTGVHPLSRFGELITSGKKVTDFSKKTQVKAAGLIDGGFMVFRKEFFDYLWPGDDCYLEKQPLEKLASEGKFMVYEHDGFWQCMDTYRELEILNALWKSKSPPWKVWRD
jgi:glucose-1-phosphate cytidylyltransferase